MEDQDLIGKVVKGEVISVKDFGAFIRLENGEQGLVHISEITNDFVKNIHEHLSEGQVLNVKVLGRKDVNKLTLSIRQAQAEDGTAETPVVVKKKKRPVGSAFEEKLTYFLKKSEEKQIDVRRNLKNKQGITKKRR